jgi:hypothetical protein
VVEMSSLRRRRCRYILGSGHFSRPEVESGGIGSRS